MVYKTSALKYIYIISVSALVYYPRELKLSRFQIKDNISNAL